MKITTTSEKLERILSDALVLFLFEGEKPAGEIEKLDSALSSAISETIRLGDFKGKLYEVTSVYTHKKIPASRVFLVGAGKKTEFDARLARNVAGAAIRRALKTGAKKNAISLG